MASLFPDTTEHRNWLVIALLAMVFIAPAGNAQTPDPWEGVNRQVYEFNDYFDQRLVRPVTTAYVNVVPPILQTGVGNFFSNINDIKVTINDLLQLKLDAAASDSARLLLNTTIGVGGLIDVASPMGLEKHDEDFGQTFGAWGFPTGPYLIIPTVGSSNVRDAFGWALGLVFNPFNYTDSGLATPMYIMDQIDSRSRLLAFDELVIGDEYIFVREAYAQSREFLVLDGQIEDEFGDF